MSRVGELKTSVRPKLKLKPNIYSKITLHPNFGVFGSFSHNLFSTLIQIQSGVAVMRKKSTTILRKRTLSGQLKWSPRRTQPPRRTVVTRSQGGLRGGLRAGLRGGLRGGMLGGLPREVFDMILDRLTGGCPGSSSDRCVLMSQVVFVPVAKNCNW